MHYVRLSHSSIHVISVAPTQAVLFCERCLYYVEQTVLSVERVWYAANNHNQAHVNADEESWGQPGTTEHMPW